MDKQLTNPKVGLSLTQKRIIAGVYLLVLVFCAANFYLHWNLLGGFDKKVLAVVTLVGVVLMHRYGPAIIEELRDYRAKRGG